MPDNYFSFFSILKIILPIIGIIFSGWLLYYFLKNKKFIETIASSIYFLFSCFIWQILFNAEIKQLEGFANKYESVFKIPFITVVATITGIFFGNLLLRLLTKIEEKRENSILFINAINSQINYFQEINNRLTSYKKQDIQKSIEFYRKSINNEKYYQIAFGKIGIYNEEEIDLISRYSIQFEQCLNDLERLLLSVKQNQQEDIITNCCETQNDKKYQCEHERIFIEIKISLIITVLLGALIIYKLSNYYFPNNYHEAEKQFLKIYEELVEKNTSSLTSIITLEKFIRLDKKLCENLLKNLQYIRKVFRKNNGRKNTIDDEKPLSLYMSLLSWKEPCIIPTSSKIKEEIKIRYIVLNHNIINFNNSKEEGNEICRSQLKRLIDLIKINCNDTITDNIEETIKYAQIDHYIVSPWGEF
jgi:uncharacterized membrane protein